MQAAGRRSIGSGAIVLTGLAALGAAVFWDRPAAAIAPGGKGGKSEKVEIDVLFSPEGGCADRIIEEIEKAKRRILVQMHFFTSKPIGEALGEAKKNGVDVEVILDGSQEKGRFARWRPLYRDGITIHFDTKHATANNKVILIDNRTIITGSYNLTKSAEEDNAENVVIIRNHEKLFEKYLENYKKHREHSRRHSG